MGKIQINKRLQQKFLGMEGGLFCKFLAQTKIRLATNVRGHNDHIEFDLVLALYSNDESSICDIKTEKLNSVECFLLKRYV